MRLWSLHPRYLDAKGLVACWREGLLARKVLLGLTRGYRNHPQLERFKNSSEPIVFIDNYLRGIYKEAVDRGYRFDRTRIGPRFSAGKLPVTEGQLTCEFEWLKTKLGVRDPVRVQMFSDVEIPVAHPLFRVIAGKVESWERLKNEETAYDTDIR